MRLLLLSLLFFSTQLLACQLTVMLEQFIPQAQRVDNNRWLGIDFERTDKLLSEAGCQYEIIELPWARALKSMAHGKLDMMLNVTKTKQRAQNFHFIGPITHESIVLALASDQPITLSKVEDILSLSKPIAVQRMAFYGEHLDELIKDPTNKNSFIQVVDNQEKFHLLRLGLVSGFLEAKQNLIMDINNTPRYQDIWFAPLVLHQTPVYYAFSKKTVDLVVLQKLASAFDRLQQQRKISIIQP
jgi:polar amino acid transport system substrate-binding protein